MIPEPAPGRHSPAHSTIAWSLFGSTVLFFVPALWLASTQSLWRFGVSNLIWALSVLAFGAVGALVASRRPDNVVGWFLAGGAALVSGGLLCVEYATRAYLTGVRPDGEVVAWVGLMAFFTGAVLLFPATTLHFPDGSLPSSGWRRVRAIAGAAIVFCLVVLALAPGSLSLGSLTVAGETRNPFGLEWDVLRDAKPAVLPVMVAVFVICFAAPYLRLRRARGVERQQLKWFVYATVLMAIGFVTFALLGALRPGEPAGEAVNAVSAAGFLALPVAVGIAVLKYRLYEIDLVINRTLVYGLLTLLLGAVYVGGVVLVPLLVPLAEGNDLVVAVSTLAVAALFSPLRRRVQRFVDRRFYRARYDAVQTLADFDGRLRHDSGIEDMGADLVTAVQKALQPASIGFSLTRQDRRDAPPPADGS